MAQTQTQSRDEHAVLPSKTIPLITTLLSAANAVAAINWLIEQINRVNSGQEPTRFEG